MRTLPLLLSAYLTIAGLAQAGLSSVMGQTGDLGQVKVEDDNDPFVPNTFVGSFRMEMHIFKGATEQNGSPANMQFWSNPEMTLIAMPKLDQGGGEIKMLTDMKGKWSYMLMTDAKGNKTAMKSRKKKVSYDQSAKEGDASKFTVTNETKVIDGHTCTKVVGTTDDGTWTGWVAKDIAVPFGDIANSMNRGAMQKNRQNWQGLQGFPLEFESVDKSGKDRVVVYVKDLQVGEVDPHVFSVSDYRVMEIPGMPGQ